MVLTNDQSNLYFYVNDQEYDLVNPAPETTTLQFLRQQGLTGTKLGCAEGGCGACTVVVASYESEMDQVAYCSTNACLLPLASVDGKQLITVEGLGNSRKPHPVQERIALCHGSQCGFCTPGIVMSLYALLRNNPEPQTRDIEDAFDGNLCRCTGYRPILDAAKTFVTTGSVCDQNNCGTERCMNTCNNHSNGTGHPNGVVDIEELQPLRTWRASDFQPYDATGDMSFPSNLVQYISGKALRPRTSLVFSGTTCHKLYRPLTLEELLSIKQEYPEAKLFSGNTEVGIETKFKHQPYPVRVYVGDIPELKTVTTDQCGLAVGANVTLTTLENTLTALVAELPTDKTEGYRALLTNLAWFAGRQIRNVATLAGNIATASPISDLNPVLIACGAELTLQALGKTPRKVSLRDFFLGYRKTALRPDEVITAVFIPVSRTHQYIRAYKQAKRKDDDIAIVNAGLSVIVEPHQGHWRVVDSCWVFGGMAPTTLRVDAMAQTVQGQLWGYQDTWDKLATTAQATLQLDYAVPGGMPEFRTTLALSFTFKFWHEVSCLLGVAGHKEDQSHLTADIPREISHGLQYYGEITDPNGIVGQAIPHLSALKQVTGEARYTDDTPRFANELYGALVLAQQAHAVILGTDASRALELDGVMGYYTAKDIPGLKQFGLPGQTEPLFAETHVVYWGQPIGIVVAKDQSTAQAAARLVHVDYEVLPPILTINDAIAKKSFFENGRLLQCGDIHQGFAEADHVFEGECRVNGQEHFYLETMAALVVPKGEDDEFEVISSTQNPTETQMAVAHTLGIPSNRVVSRVKRLGGGFGGKETRSVALTCALAVAAYRLGRPVRCMLDRDEDMIITGQRHPFLGKWKVGVKRDGKVVALDLELYSNGGHSYDLSGGVMDRAVTHADNVYHIPHVRIKGTVCRTNMHSNTAFRGFGGPQGMFITESWMREVADRLGLPVRTVQERNFYQEGQRTPFNQSLVDWHFPKTWTEALASSEYDRRRREVDQFNQRSQWKKRGLAITPTKFGISFSVLSLNQAGALVHIYTDGHILLTHGGTEMGQGLHTKMAQICAQELKVPLSLVHISETSTNTVPNTSPTAASASSDLNGMAIKNACDQLNSRLAPFRERMPQATMAELARAAYSERVSLSAQGFYATPDIGYDWATNQGQMFFYFTVGTAVTEVELDVLTGDHVVIRSDVVMDVGRSLNPAIDIGQIEGAFVQGMGWCTLEETLVHPNGTLFTRGPGNYKIPGFRDTPRDFRVHVLHNLRYTQLKTICSSKGIGEPPLFLGCSVLFALRDALGAARREHGVADPVVLDSPATAESLRLQCRDPIVQRCAVQKKKDQKPWVVRPSA
ncbi:hypothetical protein IWQ62_002234 [Dispira parvispora]|uniref:xanthine dehydrogenase n=1 Tax=Dispira parvispora TaxID=1520584 RepID=A0A9W8AU92_9FUNG|nr:hypothetical protein IWQ62_002234 [Dispira parvispora]